MAVTTTEFRNWLAVADPKIPEEVYDLFTAVRDEKPGHLYDIKCAEGKIFVSAESVEETLSVLHARKTCVSEYPSRARGHRQR